MAGRNKIYEDVDVDSAKDEWVKIACDLFGQPYDDRDTNDDRDANATSHRSIREISRIMHLSEVKVKKLLIAGNYYSTKETRAVSDLQRQGFSIEEISNELGISTSKVKTLMSYKYGRLYGIGTNSAKRNKAYRERKKEAAMGGNGDE